MTNFTKHPLCGYLMQRQSSLERYGYKPTIKQSNLTVEEGIILSKVCDMIALIDDEKVFWNRTRSTVTNESLSKTGSIFTCISTYIL